MKRLLADTNIYGELVLDADYSCLKEAIAQKYVLHGFTVVRKELRDTPKTAQVYGKNLRTALLHVYDELTKKSYPLTNEIEDLAKNYHVVYRQLGGIRSYNKLGNDFCVVACAAIHQIDVVVSEDNKSMLSELALKSYALVHALRKRRTPTFIGYLEFKRWLRE